MYQTQERYTNHMSILHKENMLVTSSTSDILLIFDGHIMSKGYT